MTDTHKDGQDERMPSDIRRRCKALRRTCKTGGYASPEDMTFLEKCYRAYPAEYKQIGDEVFDETRPVTRITP